MDQEDVDKEADVGEGADGDEEDDDHDRGAPLFGGAPQYTTARMKGRGGGCW